MSLYPTSPVPCFPYEIREEGKTISVEFDSGKSQHLRLRRFPKRKIGPLIYRGLNFNDRKIIYSFFRNYWKNFNSFYFYDWILREWIDEYVGRGDGSTAIFDLHSKNTVIQSLVIYVDGVQKQLGTHYNFLSGGGIEGADRIQFTSGNIPENGALITSDFSGYLRLKAEFYEDSYIERISVPELFDIEITLYEVQW
ncbi:MAG: hypothetical protein ABIL39_10780 [candidate division WOR-3 bacterium]